MTKRELNKNRHSRYSLIYHLVVVTKYRYKCINKNLQKELEKILNRLFENKNCKILEIGGEEDHIHILFEAPPQVQPSQLVNSIKTTSSRLIRKKYPDYIKKYYDSGFWSRSYCILSAGKATINTIKKYIEKQRTKK